MSLIAPHGIIDSHLHIWELGVSKYEWIKPELGFLYNDFPITEARFELSAAGVDNAILVQVEDSSADTEYMMAVAQSNEWVLGVVGWVKLEAPQEVESYLESLQQGNKLVGIRHLLHDDPRNGFLKMENVLSSLRIIAAQGLSFDVSDAWPKDLNDVSALAEKIEDLRIVIDHLGKPPIGDLEKSNWREQFKKASSYENVSTKLSGLLNAATNYDARSLKQLFEEALEMFGAGRILFGGDWPVSTLNGHYAETVEVLFELISSLSIDEQDSILYGNACSVYALDTQQSVGSFQTRGVN